MKKSVVAIAVSSTLAFSILALSCAEPAPAFQAPIPSTTASAATSEEILEDMRLSTMWSIEETIIRGQNSPDYLYVTLRDIEEAQKALKELEAQRQATQRVIDGYVRAGQMIPNFQIAVLESIEEARREVLARTGLLQ